VAGQIVVPAGLQRSHARYFGEATRLWIELLPALVEKTLGRWNLRMDGPPMWGAVALVLPVLQADEMPAMLKLQPIDDETAGEGRALELWAGAAAVRLLNWDRESGTMLLERLDPRRALTAEVDDQLATQVIAELLVELNSVPAPPEMRRLDHISAQILDDASVILPTVADPGERSLLARCADRLRELLTEPVERRLLHWDLHYDNVLARLNQPHTWVSIDPKPLAGDSGFELLPALWNRWDDLVATGNPSRALARRFDLMVDVMGIDPRRAACWSLTRILQNALWDLGRLGATAIHPVHRTIATTLDSRLD
jgi:streptomycin 6-kinase